MKLQTQFDKKDLYLQKMINQVIDHGTLSSSERDVLAACLHPHGIQNMVDSHEVRMALAVVNLLERLNGPDGSRERLEVLRTLHNEVVSSAQTPFRFNTSRVLIQIMKDIVRSRNNETEQLKLIHDFQKVAAGNPRIVRSFLTKYFLLEMPEEWNQKTLDDHVHDSSTNGRKNPTYLLMDARVKGIRRLSVVYHNYVDPEIAFELMEAASIMEISVRICVKFKGVFKGKYVEILWTPKGFTGPKSVLEFLRDPRTVAFMEKGREAERWAEHQVFRTLELFNEKHIKELSELYGVDLPQLNKQKFNEFVGSGRPSFVHLAEFAHQSFLPYLEKKVAELKSQSVVSSDKESEEISDQIKKLDSLTAQELYLKWIHPDQNPSLPNLTIPQNDDRPELLKIDFANLLMTLKELRPNSRIILLPARMKSTEVLELLWDSKGLITHLEVFNLKEWLRGRLDDLNAVTDLQSAINHKDALRIKHIILDMLKKETVKDDPRLKTKLTEILQNIPRLLSFYEKQPLGSRFGTNSTHSLGTGYGMGLAVPETLPLGAQKIINNKNGPLHPMRIPLEVAVSFSDTYKEPIHQSGITKWIRHNLGFLKFGLTRKREWRAHYADAVTAKKGNIVTLGGRTERTDNGFIKKQSQQKTDSKTSPFRYTNTTLLNILKVTIGFLPAFLTFLLTQNWWVLAWFGALIWFSITGIRNIIQAVISGGGFQKGARIDWKQLINWSRISDSLMYTGMSVVLLEGFTRNILLGHILGITVDKAPLLVFSIIALANGIYISSHNIFRGFPKTAVVGNLFRSILAIPVAMVYNVMLAMILPVITGMPAAAILVPAAAIVSKFASDTVAGIIESFADKRNNFRLRTSDFSQGTKELFTCFTHIELAFPKRNILELMSKPLEFVQLLARKAPTMELETIITSLDLMYMWYYQPCAQQVFMERLKKMTAEERLIYVRFQGALYDYKEVSRLFLSGMLGSNFSHALAFYLDNYKDYLKALEEMRVALDKKSTEEASSPTSFTKRVAVLWNSVKSRITGKISSQKTEANSAKLLSSADKLKEPSKESPVEKETTRIS